MSINLFQCSGRCKEYSAFLVWGCLGFFPFFSCEALGVVVVLLLLFYFYSWRMILMV